MDKLTAEQKAPTDLPKNQLHILRHSLGLTRGKEMFRNHFVTGEGSSDYPDCCALVDAGLMTRHKGNELSGGDDWFIVTDAGKALCYELLGDGG